MDDNRTGVLMLRWETAAPNPSCYTLVLRNSCHVITFNSSILSISTADTVVKCTSLIMYNMYRNSQNDNATSDTPSAN